MIEELVARTFAAQEASKLEHWRTNSRSAHEALGVFYSASGDALDSIIECYQGTYQTKIGKPKPFDANGDMSDILTEELDWLDANREEICNGSAHIGNLVDNLSAVYSKTLFLLGLK